MEDLMQIRTPWMKRIIAKLIKRFVRENLGINLDFVPGDLTLSIKDGKVTGNICGDFSLPLEDLNNTSAVRMLEDDQ